MVDGPLRPASNAGLRAFGTDRGGGLDRMVDARPAVFAECLAADGHGQRQLQRCVPDGHARLDRAADRRPDRRRAQPANSEFNDSGRAGDGFLNLHDQLERQHRSGQHPEGDSTSEQGPSERSHGAVDQRARPQRVGRRHALADVVVADGERTGPEGCRPRRTFLPANPGRLVRHAERQRDRRV